MSIDTWVEQPDIPPYECAITHLGEAKDGPFFSTRLDFMEPQFDGTAIRVKPQVYHLYLSELAIREMLSAPGSPLAVISVEGYNATAESLSISELRIEQLESDLAELEAEIATLRAAPAVDVQALANALVIPLGDTFARKSGRPRKDAA